MHIGGEHEDREPRNAARIATQAGRAAARLHHLLANAGGDAGGAADAMPATSARTARAVHAFTRYPVCACAVQ
jgi:hypothetical protein